MTQHEVAVTRVTFYRIEADNEDEAIDLVLDGQGEEIHQDTMNAEIVEMTEAGDK